MCRQFDSSQHHKQKGLQLVASLSVCGAKAPFLPGALPPNPRVLSGRPALRACNVASLSVCGAEAPFLPGALPPNPRVLSGRPALRACNVASLSVCGAEAPFLPGALPPNPRVLSGRPPCGLVMLQAFLFVVLKFRSYRGLCPQTPASFQEGRLAGCHWLQTNLLFCGDEAPLFFVLLPSRGKPFGKNLILST